MVWLNVAALAISFLFVTLPTLAADMAAFSVIKRIYGQNEAVAIIQKSADGEIVFSHCDSTYWIVNTQTNIIKKFIFEEKFPIALLNPNSSQFLLANLDKLLLVGIEDKYQKIIQDQTGKISSANYSPTGKFFLTVTADHTIMVWDAKTAQLLHKISDPANIVSAIFLRDDTTLWATSNDGQSIMFRVNSLQEHEVVPAPSRWRTMKEYFYNDKNIERLSSAANATLMSAFLIYLFFGTGAEPSSHKDLVVVVIE